MLLPFTLLGCDTTGRMPLGGQLTSNPDAQLMAEEIGTKLGISLIFSNIEQYRLYISLK